MNGPVVRNEAFAVFLDREGVITPKRPVGSYVLTPEQAVLAPGVADTLRALTNAGCRLFMVSNQSCVSRGLISREEAERLNRLIMRQLAERGVVIEDARLCPHTDADGCACRKPKPGMILDLCSAHGLDPRRSALIGDSSRDIEAARAAGCAVRIRLSESGTVDLAATHTVDSLGRAVRIILDETTREMRGKIISLDEAAERLAPHRAAGKRIVLCHGCYDLIHPGHLKHLTSAKREGDVLVVAMKTDRHVNKGPGRPVFSQDVRAEFLAALDCVDVVAVSDHPNAVPAIRAVRPDVFAKGGKHAGEETNVASTVYEEKRAVESVGGRLHFTYEPAFSSSALLNRHFNMTSEDARDFLQEFRLRYGADDVISEIRRIRPLRILLIGDAVIDEYCYVRPMNKPSKANTIAVKQLDTEAFIGGIFACANHVAGFCDTVHVVTSLGNANSRETFIRERLKSNVTLKVIYRDDAPTIVKRRFVEKNFLSKLFEVYEFNDQDLPPAQEAELHSYLSSVLPNYDVVICLDYLHGLISSQTVRLLSTQAKFLAVNTQTNAANIGYNPITRYPRADFVCIDDQELRMATLDRFGDVEPLIERIANQLSCSKAIGTLGHRGCMAYERGMTMSRIPVLAPPKVVDAVGAGDAFLAITAPCVAAGLPMELVGFIGNAVGSQAVTIVGNRESVEPRPLFDFIKALMA